MYNFPSSLLLGIVPLAASDLLGRRAEAVKKTTQNTESPYVPMSHIIYSETPLRKAE
jgi:hypothetical protein